MSDETKNTAPRAILTSVAPQLFVADIEASYKFYEKLGFIVDFIYGDPPFYGQVSRDHAQLTLRHIDEPVFAGDIREREAVRGAVEGARRVYHLAANPNLWVRDRREFDRVNHQGTVHVLDAAIEAGAELRTGFSVREILRDGNRVIGIRGRELNDEVQAEMAEALGCDSLRYLPVESIARAINMPTNKLCQACITGRYPTPHGQRLYEIALENVGKSDCSRRTYEVQHELTFAK